MQRRQQQQQLPQHPHWRLHRMQKRMSLRWKERTGRSVRQISVSPGWETWPFSVVVSPCCMWHLELQ